MDNQFRRLIVTCMDGRNNGHLDSEWNDGNTLFMRNGGGNVHMLVSSIIKTLHNHPTIGELVILPHIDCGAAKFEGIDYPGKERREADRDWLRTELKNAGIEGIRINIEHVIDTPKLGTHKHGTKELIVTRESGLLYSVIAPKAGTPIHDAYTVQGPVIEELYHAIQIAVEALGIRTIKFVPRTEERDAMMVDMRKLGEQEFMKNRGITPILIDPEKNHRQRPKLTH